MSFISVSGLHSITIAVYDFNTYNFSSNSLCIHGYFYFHNFYKTTFLRTYVTWINYISLRNCIAIVHKTNRKQFSHSNTEKIVCI